VPLSRWGDHERLLRLTFDPFTRKVAMYWLGQTPPDPTAARRAWEHLHDPETTSTHAYETLETYVAHAPRGESVPRLVEIARDDEREVVQYHAVYALSRLGARAELLPLVPLLEEPPCVTWSIHLALLDACAKRGIAPPSLDLLRGADHLDVQEELARWAVSPPPCDPL
jgi:HEAT repeat protein